MPRRIGSRDIYHRLPPLHYKGPACSGIGGNNMMDQQTRFDRAIRGFDAANARDPNFVMIAGENRPRELVYAQRMTAWLLRIEPDASEALRLAARSQHICRWTRPRADYPMTRAGYHRWRTELGRFHAETAGGILRDAGYEQTTIDRVGSLLRKEHLKTDPEVQTLEDVICLVFLENYFADFAAQHPREKVIDIVRKTWKKMSVRGHEQALGLALPPGAAELVGEALNGQKPEPSAKPEFRNQKAEPSAKPEFRNQQPESNPNDE